MDQLLFHLAVMCVFSMHNVDTAPPLAPGTVALAAAPGGSYAAAAQAAALRCHAAAVAFRFAAAVTNCTASMAATAAAGGGVGDVEAGFGAVSTACHVMLQWLVANPHHVLAAPPGESAAPAAAPAVSVTPEGQAEAAARASFLAAAATLATHLAELTRLRRAHDQDWQVRGRKAC